MGDSMRLYYNSKSSSQKICDIWDYIIADLACDMGYNRSAFVRILRSPDFAYTVRIKPLNLLWRVYNRRLTVYAYLQNADV